MNIHGVRADGAVLVSTVHGQVNIVDLDRGLMSVCLDDRQADAYGPWEPADNSLESRRYLSSVVATARTAQPSLFKLDAAAAAKAWESRARGEGSPAKKGFFARAKAGLDKAIEKLGVKPLVDPAQAAAPLTTTGNTMTGKWGARTRARGLSADPVDLSSEAARKAWDTRGRSEESPRAREGYGGSRTPVEGDQVKVMGKVYGSGKVGTITSSDSQGAFHYVRAADGTKLGSFHSSDLKVEDEDDDEGEDEVSDDPTEGVIGGVRMKGARSPGSSLKRVKLSDELAGVDLSSEAAKKAWDTRGRKDKSVRKDKSEAPVAPAYEQKNYRTVPRKVGDIGAGDTLHDHLGREVMHITAVHNAKQPGYRIATGIAIQKDGMTEPGQRITRAIGHKSNMAYVSFNHPDHPAYAKYK